MNWRSERWKERWGALGERRGALTEVIERLDESVALRAGQVLLTETGRRLTGHYRPLLLG